MTLYANKAKHRVSFDPPGEIPALVASVLTNWCKEQQLKGYFWVGTNVAYFEEESDAILFRLVWG